jgi:chromosome segregation ATPase
MTDRFDKMEEEADAILAGLNAPAEPAEDSTPPPPEADETPAETETVADEVAVESADAAPETETAVEATPAQQEETVPLSRYKNAEKLMHQKAQEAADLRRRNAQLEAELQQLHAKATQPASSTPQSGDEDPELKEFAEFYPEIAKPVTKQLQALQEKLTHQEAWLAQQRELQHQAMLQAHWDAITAVHPDAASFREDPQFEAWLAEQPPMVQYAKEHGSPSDVNYVLSSYKATLQPATAAPSQPAQRTDKLAQARQAAGPSVGRVPGQPTKHIYTEAEVLSLPEEELDKNWPEIHRQYKAGLIV